jgi:hypothetical protein
MRHYKYNIKVIGFQHEIGKKKQLIIPTSTIHQNINCQQITLHQGLQLQSILNGKHQMKVHL